MGKPDLVKFLNKSFGGFLYLIRFVRKHSLESVSNSDRVIKNVKETSTFYPYCGSKFSPEISFCEVCGEPLKIKKH